MPDATPRPAAHQAHAGLRGHTTPAFEYGCHLSDGSCCMRIVNAAAIWSRGYARATTSPASKRELG